MIRSIYQTFRELVLQCWGCLDWLCARRRVNSHMSMSSSATPHLGTEFETLQATTKKLQLATDDWSIFQKGSLTFNDQVFTSFYDWLFLLRFRMKAPNWEERLMSSKVDMYDTALVWLRMIDVIWKTGSVHECHFAVIHQFSLFGDLQVFLWKKIQVLSDPAFHISFVNLIYEGGREYL